MEAVIAKIKPKHAATGLLILLTGFLAYLYFQPVPEAIPLKEAASAPPVQAAALPWPSAGQAAIGASGYGLLESHNDAMAVPIGSTAKVITALAVLKKQPIPAGGQGPTLTLTQADVDSYNSYYSQDGSSTAVIAGEKITEYQALQSLMLPSSNNMADTLAAWAFGSVDTYLKYANPMLKSMALNHTTVGDTNGFSDKTTSTAGDLVKLGLMAINNPTLAGIVSQVSASIPVAGTVRNTNFLLGTDGVIGVKTGHTDAAGGCYIFASRKSIYGHQTILVGAILSQPDLQAAIGAAPALINTAVSSFVPETVVRKGQELVLYKTKWGATAPAVAAKDVTLLVWKGRDVKIVNEAQPLKPPVAKGNSVGQLKAAFLSQYGDSQLRLTQNLPGPSFWWRLTRH